MFKKFFKWLFKREHVPLSMEPSPLIYKSPSPYLDALDLEKSLTPPCFRISADYIFQTILKNIKSDAIGLVSVRKEIPETWVRDKKLMKGVHKMHDPECISLTIHMPEIVVTFIFDGSLTLKAYGHDEEEYELLDKAFYSNRFNTYIPPDYAEEFRDILYKLEEYLDGGLNMDLWDGFGEWLDLSISMDY